MLLFYLKDSYIFEQVQKKIFFTWNSALFFISIDHLKKKKKKKKKKKIKKKKKKKKKKILGLVILV